MLDMQRKANVAVNQRFRKHERLKRQADFDRVFARRYRAGNDALVVYVAPNDLGRSRLGIIVGRRVGGAVVRNYVRRRIREAFRRQKDRLPAALDIICVAQPAAADRAIDVAGALPMLVRKALKRLRAG